jgi:hypothetical protein
MALLAVSSSLHIPAEKEQTLPQIKSKNYIVFLTLIDSS